MQSVVLEFHGKMQSNMLEIQQLHKSPEISTALYSSANGNEAEDREI